MSTLLIPGNSTTTPLGASQTFTGSPIDLDGYAGVGWTGVEVLAYGTATGASFTTVITLHVEWSNDGVLFKSFDQIEDASFPDWAISLVVPIRARFMRVRLVNGHAFPLSSTNMATTLSTDVALPTRPPRFFHDPAFQINVPHATSTQLYAKAGSTTRRFADIVAFTVVPSYGFVMPPQFRTFTLPTATASTETVDEFIDSAGIGMDADVSGTNLTTHTGTLGLNVFRPIEWQARFQVAGTAIIEGRLGDGNSRIPINWSLAAAGEFVQAFAYHELTDAAGTPLTVKFDCFVEYRFK